MSNLNNAIRNLPESPPTSKHNRSTHKLDKFEAVGKDPADIVGDRMRAAGEIGADLVDHKGVQESVSAEEIVGTGVIPVPPESVETPVVTEPANEGTATSALTSPTATPPVIVTPAVTPPKVGVQESHTEDTETPVVFLADITFSVGLATNNSPETSQLLKQLGLNANRETKLLQLEKTNSRPLQPKPVVDNSGRISDIINGFQSEYGIVVVPRKITNIPDWVTPRDHYVFEYEKEFFFAPRDVESLKSEMWKMVDDILGKLETGDLVRKDLIQTFQYKGETVRTLLLSQEGLAEATTLLSNYGATVVSAGEWSLSLVVGDYIQVK